MPSTQPWYVEERAEHLAIVHLTARDDLVVQRRPMDFGPELLVTLSRDGGFSGRVFAVEVHARTSGERPPRLDPRELEREHAVYRDAPFPVLMLLFDMRGDRGYFRWIKEPADGAMLRLADSVALAELTPEALDAIVERVDDWYDRRS